MAPSVCLHQAQSGNITGPIRVLARFSGLGSLLRMPPTYDGTMTMLQTLQGYCGQMTAP